MRCLEVGAEKHLCGGLLIVLFAFINVVWIASFAALLFSAWLHGWRAAYLVMSAPGPML